tara:strand:+ start:155 stop:379 length:225 start_codon:yes stop_codon:yes gene_type:complete
MGIWNKFVTFFNGEPTGERTRDEKGRFVKDDPSTSTNEAYTDGKTPTKVRKTKTKTETTTRGRGRPKGSKNKPK